MTNPNDHWPIYFLDVVADHLTHECGHVRIEEQEAENDGKEAVFSLRHDASGLLTDLRVPESPSFMDAQEWCLGFLSRPLHELLRAADERKRATVEESKTVGEVTE